jgi:hypothetical protein
MDMRPSLIRRKEAARVVIAIALGAWIVKVYPGIRAIHEGL